MRFMVDEDHKGLSGLPSRGLKVGVVGCAEG